MKNQWKELQRKTQKHSSGGRRRGIYIPYSYEHKSATDLTWCGDFYFWLNGIRYTVTFVHPRMKYKDECGSMAWNQLQPTYPKSKTIWHTYATKKLGKSRKKATLFTAEETNKEALDAWYKQLWELEAEIVKDVGNGVRVQPSVSVVSWNWAKNIDICVPYEILTHEQAVFFTNMVKEMYKSGELYNWVDKMKAVCYSADNWNKENSTSL